MKRIRSFVVILAAVSAIACQTASSPGSMMAAGPTPVPAAQPSNAVAVPAADSRRGRTILVVALLAGLLAAALLISASSDDGGVY